MDYTKIESALASALVEDVHNFNVWVRTVAPVDKSCQEELIALGVRAEIGKNLFSARISRANIDALSDQSYVRQISLAQLLFSK